MGATTSITEITPSEVHMDSKHIDKIIRMAAELDRDNVLEHERAFTELDNQFSILLFMVAVRLVRGEPYVLISSDQNILSRFRFLAERISNTTDVSLGVLRDDPLRRNRYLLTPREPHDPGAIPVLDLDHPNNFVTYEATHRLAKDDNYHVDRIIGLAKDGAWDFGADHKTMPNEKERHKLPVEEACALFPTRLTRVAYAPWRTQTTPKARFVVNPWLVIDLAWGMTGLAF